MIDTEEYRALCKWRGALVIMVLKKLENGKNGSCPECGGVIFNNNNEWTECEYCGFSILTSDINKVNKNDRNEQ